MTTPPLPAPEDFGRLGIACDGTTAVDLQYEMQATTLCAEGTRHRHRYFCLDETDNTKSGPYFTEWICGQ